MQQKHPITAVLISSLIVLSANLLVTAAIAAPLAVPADPEKTGLGELLAPLEEAFSLIVVLMLAVSEVVPGRIDRHVSGSRKDGTAQIFRRSKKIPDLRMSTAFE